MTIVYREEKGAALTPSEVDHNFHEIVNRLQALEKSAEVSEGLEKVVLEGNDLHFLGTFGKVFGSIPLPKSTLNPRGEWRPDLEYSSLDLVTHGGTLFCCAEAHKSTSWEHHAPHWKELFSIPSPSKAHFPIYERETLPKDPPFGALAIFMNEKTPQLIFYIGSAWHPLTLGEKL